MTDSCPNCGRLNRPGARYCASCQRPLAGAATEERAVPLQPGQMLGAGDYRVIRPLGKGGMGATWLVAQTKAFDRLAVLKEIIDYFDPADPAARQAVVDRFEAEARTLAELKHPGIPDLYAYFSEGPSSANTKHGHNYLVMEYIEGADLSKGLTRDDGETGQTVPGGPLPIDHVLSHIIRICEVLEYLSGRQPPLVHNDVKPANILIDGHSGQAVLVDFGTAKARYLRAAGRPDQKRDSIYGTVGYAAPELYQGRSEPRSDVYSLAATAYHLLTDDDPRDHPGQYPQLDRMAAPLAAILRSALAADVEDRLTAAQFREQLEGYFAGQTAPLRALAFPNGDAAGDRQQLLSLAVKHWHYASTLLADGTLARWLSQTLRDSGAALAAQAAAKLWPRNPDAALDAFIRQLDPRAMPPGKLELRTPTLRLTAEPAQGPLTLGVEIANGGLGYLRGEILSSQPWLTVAPGTFGCPPGEVQTLPVMVHPAALPTPGGTGQAAVAAITLSPAGGEPEVVPVQVTASGRTARRPGTRAIDLSPDRVDFGSVSRYALSTRRLRVTVKNTGDVPARCRVQAVPAWLVVKPEAFQLQPGAQQVLELVGRVDKLVGRTTSSVPEPVAQGGRRDASLAISVEGGQDRELPISVRIRGEGLF